MLAEALVNFRVSDSVLAFTGTKGMSISRSSNGEGVSGALPALAARTLAAGRITLTSIQGKSHHKSYGKIPSR
jgi:hypothetical protein